MWFSSSNSLTNIPVPQEFDLPWNKKRFGKIMIGSWDFNDKRPANDLKKGENHQETITRKYTLVFVIIILI